MSNSYATGLDDISVKLLKISSNVIGEILTYLLNMSIKNGVGMNEKSQSNPSFEIWWQFCGEQLSTHFSFNIC